MREPAGTYRGYRVEIENVRTGVQNVFINGAASGYVIFPTIAFEYAKPLIDNMAAGLLGRIKAVNDKSRAWVADDPKNRWAGIFIEDLAHWTSCGVYTAEQFNEMLDAEFEKEVRKSRYDY